MMIPTTLLQAILATLVAGWSDEVLEPPIHETAIKIYYDSHASENNDHCKAPYIDDFDRVEVVETRHRYRDGLKDRQAWRIGPGRNACVASNSRRFVLIRSGANLRVASMSPPQRG